MKNLPGKARILLEELVCIQEDVERKRLSDAEQRSLSCVYRALKLKTKNLVLNTNEFSRKVVATLQKEKPAYEKYDKATELAARNNFRSALSLYKDAIALKPDEALFHTDMGFAYMKLFADREAENELKKAIELYPSFFKPQFFMGRLHYENHNYGNAVTYLEAADALIPNVPFLRYMLAGSYESTGRMQDAVTLYRQIAQSYPNDEIGVRSRQRLNILLPPSRIQP